MCFDWGNHFVVRTTQHPLKSQNFYFCSIHQNWTKNQRLTIDATWQLTKRDAPDETWQNWMRFQNMKVKSCFKRATWYQLPNEFLRRVSSHSRSVLPPHQTNYPFSKITCAIFFVCGNKPILLGVERGIAWRCVSEERFRTCPCRFSNPCPDIRTLEREWESARHLRVIATTFPSERLYGIST